MSATSLDQVAIDLAKRYRLNPETLVVEVRSGHGELLDAFQHLGIRVLGVESDLLLMSYSWSKRIDTISADFNAGTGDYIRHRYGPARLVLSRSVRAGTEAFQRLISGASYCLDADGVVAIQSAGVNAFVEVRPDPPMRPLCRAA